MKKIIALLILASLLLGCASCAGKQSSDGASTKAATTSSAAVSAKSDFPEPNIPDSDYGGKKFTILYPGWSLYNNYYFAEDENGEAVNDALYKRSRDIEERLNIKFVYNKPGYIETIYPAVEKTVLAGDAAYDLVLTHCASNLSGYVTQKIVMNWNDIPYIDMDKTYWNQSVRENFNLHGILPFAANDFILPDVNSIFFNKDLIENYKLDNPYKLVTDGKWTLDKLAQMSSVASADLNGDGQFTEDDQYGYVGELGWQTASMLHAAGGYIVQTDKSGDPQLVVNGEKTLNLINKLYDLLYTGNKAFTWAYSAAYDPNAGGKPPVAFDSGHALFYQVPLSLAPTFRETDVDFGILPFPKYDEAQKDYYSLNWAGFMCVPMTADPELTGKTVELLGAENLRTVIPVFYDVLLGEKISRDDESKQMLDVIFDSSVYDLGVNLGLYSAAYTPLVNKSKDYTSFYDSNAATWQKTLADYNKACEDYSAAISK